MSNRCKAWLMPRQFNNLRKEETMSRNTERSTKAREMLAQGKTPKEIGEELGTKTIGWIYKLKTAKSKGGRPKKAMATAAAKENGSFSSTVVYRAKNGGSALFATQSAAKTYLGSSAQIVPVAVLS